MERFYWSQTGGNSVRRQTHIHLGHHDDQPNHGRIQRQERPKRTSPKSRTDRGPEITIHESFVESAGELIGTGALAYAQNVSPGQSTTLIDMDDPCRLTHYKEGWAGSHEFQTGSFLTWPSNKRDVYVKYSNFMAEWLVLRRASSHRPRQSGSRDRSPSCACAAMSSSFSPFEQR